MWWDGRPPAGLIPQNLVASQSACLMGPVDVSQIPHIASFPVCLVGENASKRMRPILLRHTHHARRRVELTEVAGSEQT